MDGYHQHQYLEGEVRIPSGCAISGIIDRSGKRFSGGDAITSHTFALPQSYLSR